jgi:5,5'-dehydrodivanillate O-demethylase oxygenase subunit
MLTTEQQERLTRVGPGTPAGELLRRYWLPVAASCEIRHGFARRVRHLGEDLVAFRDLNGRAGLVAERCPHRQTSLAFGCVDNEGIRCPYHGWKFDARGACLETPAEEHGSTLKERIRTTAYPVEELAGLMFAYLGPRPAPLLPRFDLFVWNGVLRDIGVAELPCNWLQIMENSVDPHHLEWLHGHHLASVREQHGLSTPTHYRRRQVRTGFDVFEYGIIKRRILEDGSEEDEDWKIGHPLVFPAMLRVGAGAQHRMQIRVPIDDTTTRHYWYSCYRPAPGVDVPHQAEVPLYEVPWRTPNGDFILDFVDGGDIMACVTQGPIADRTREHLAGSDRGIALLRRLLLEQIDKVAGGEDPLGIVRSTEKNQLIELPQEQEKYRHGSEFLVESIEMGHARHSPIKQLVLEMLARSSPR